MTTHTRARTADQPASQTARPGTVSVRSRVVFGTLVGAMTLVGGLLLLTDQGATGAGSLSGAAAGLSPLMSLEAPERAAGLFETRSELDRERWVSIVIHHSGSRNGSPESLDREHRSMGLAGLGYHFVIGNGSGMSNGEVFRSERWLDQLPGAHVAGPRGETLNSSSIGICLVGDGDRGEFTPAQLEQLGRLVSTLADRLDIDPARVVLHRDVALTTSPGRFFPEAMFRERFDLRG